MSTLQSLPEEVLLAIFRRLDLCSLLRAERVSKAWLCTIRTSLPIWKKQLFLLKCREGLRIWREMEKMVPLDSLDVKLYRNSVVSLSLLIEALCEQNAGHQRLMKKSVGFA